MRTNLHNYLVLACCALALVSCGGKGPEFNQSTDVGTVSIPGSYSYDKATDTYTITGAGVNLWNEKDACQLVWKKVTGDFLLEGEVSFEGEGVNGHRKIGFMIRESLDEDSRYADIAIHGDGLTSLQYREKKGGLTAEKASEKKSIGPTVIRLVRVGNRFSMRTGKGAIPDTDDAALLLDLPEECYVGLFVCSHEENVSETAYFKNVVLTQDMPAEKGIAKISIFTDHIEAIARQEGISFAEAAKLVRDMGYTGADIRVMQRESEIVALDSLGFAHSCAITDINYARTDQDGIEDRTLMFMQAEGFKTLLVVPGLVPDDFTKAQRDEARQRIIAFTKRGTEKGYKILVEDYDNPRSLCYNAELLDTLFHLSPSLGLVFDTGNFLYAGDDAEVCMERFKDRVGHVHLKDRVSPTDMKCTPAGTGCIPIESLIATLEKNNYPGWYTVEHFGTNRTLTFSKTAYDNTLAALKKAKEKE